METGHNEYDEGEGSLKIGGQEMGKGAQIRKSCLFSGCQGFD